MATSFLSRKPDSGLGNIGASPAAPSRNVDWVLMTVQFALTVIGCFLSFSSNGGMRGMFGTFVGRRGRIPDRDAEVYDQRRAKSRQRRGSRQLSSPNL